MAAADRLIAELREGAELLDEGSFTISAEKLAEKMARFRYADRSLYLTTVVEGLLAVGVPHIELRRAGLDLVLATGPLPFEIPDLEARVHDLWAHALTPGDGPVSYFFNRLAVGLDMGLGHAGLQRVSLELVQEGASAAVFLQPRAAPVPRAAHPEPGLRLLFDRSLFALTGGPGAELGELEQRLRVAGRVWLEGRALRPPRRTLDQLHAENGADFVGRVGFVARQDRPTIELCLNGVVVERVAVSGHRPEQVAELVFHGLDVRRDLGQAKLVRDERVEAALAWANEAMVESAEALREAALTGRHDPRRWPNMRLHRVLGPHPSWEPDTDPGSTAFSRGCTLSLVSLLAVLMIPGLMFLGAEEGWRAMVVAVSVSVVMTILVGKSWQSWWRAHVETRATD